MLKLRQGFVAITILLCAAHRNYAQAPISSLDSEAAPTKGLVSGDPFVGLLDEVQLSAVPKATDKAVNPVDLGQFDPSLLGKCQLSIANDFVDLDGVYEFTPKTELQSNDGSWGIMISRRADGKAGGPQLIGSGKLTNEPISRLFARSNRLFMEWNPENITRFSGQLSNATIELSAGSARHAVRLRKLELKSPVVLDLEKDVIRIPLNITDLPAKDLLGIKINDVELQGYDKSAGFQTYPKSGSTKIGESMRLSRADAIATTINLSLVANSDTPQLIVRTTYSVGDDHNRPLIAKSVSSTRESLRGNLEEGERRLSEAKAAIPGIESRLKSALELRPNDASEQIAKQNKIGQARSDLRRAQSALRRYERSVPKLKSTLESAEKVGDVGKALHKNLRLHISVVASTDKQSLELVRFGDLKLATRSALIGTP